MREDQLLQRFSAKGSQAAFAELVRRHLDFVYSVCRRKVGDRELAQDITQTVFLLLAAKAGSFKSGTVLSGWLFQTAHLACQNALRSEARRKHYEQKAMQERNHTASLEPDLWPQVEPVLDDALAQLSASDRDAVLLHFVEEMSPDEMAVALGISAAAAQKRVSRALARLRRGLEATGTTLTVTVIGALLTEKMVQAAPAAAVDGVLAAIHQAGLGAAAGVAGAGLTNLGPTHWMRFGRPAAFSKTPGMLAIVIVGVAALGIGAFALVTAGQRPVPRPPGAVAESTPAKTITLRGSVVTPGGSPAAGATVTVLRYAPPGGMGSQFARVRTDAGGRYTATGSASEQDQWAVVADSGTRLGFGVPGAACVLVPPTQIRLRFVGADGRPLPDLSVQPLLLSGVDAAGQPQAVSLALGCPKRLVVRTDQDGRAVFAGLPQGWIASFAVLDEKYQRRPPSADGLPLARGLDSGEYTVSATLGASAEGQLRYGPSGLPAARVRIGAQETSTSAWGEAQTDANGYYRIVQLTPGRYTLAVDEQSPSLESGWTAAAVQNVTLGAGQSAAGQDMRLVRGALITGKVTHRHTQNGSQRPVVGTEIGAYGPAHPATGAWVGGGWTQADGTYQIRVAPGTQHVYPMAAPGSGGTDITVREGRQAVVNFAVP